MSFAINQNMTDFILFFNEKSCVCLFNTPKVFFWTQVRQHTGPSQPILLCEFVYVLCQCTSLKFLKLSFAKCLKALLFWYSTSILGAKYKQDPPLQFLHIRRPIIVLQPFPFLQHYDFALTLVDLVQHALLLGRCIHSGTSGQVDAQHAGPSLSSTQLSGAQ